MTDVARRQARTQKNRIDTALLDRRRRDALAALGETLYELSTSGEIELDELPELARAVQEVEAIDREIAEAEREGGPGDARRPVRLRPAAGSGAARRGGERGARGARAADGFRDRVGEAFREGLGERVGEALRERMGEGFGEALRERVGDALRERGGRTPRGGREPAGREPAGREPVGRERVWRPSLDDVPDGGRDDGPDGAPRAVPDDPPPPADRGAGRPSQKQTAAGPVPPPAGRGSSRGPRAAVAPASRTAPASRAAPADPADDHRGGIVFVDDDPPAAEQDPDGSLDAYMNDDDVPRRR